MSSLRGPIIGGLIGGVIGMILWAVVGVFTGREVGLVAWFVGVFVGVGVKTASKSVPPVAAAMCAAVLAFVSVIGGKFLVAATASTAVSFLGHAAADEAELSDNDCIADMCYAEATRREDAGETLDWPEGGDPGDAYAPEHYPADIRRGAEGKWAGMSPAEKKAYRDHVKMEMHGQVDQAADTGSMFLSMFGPFDILWTALAVGCAYRINTRDDGSKSEPEGSIEPTTPSAGPLAGMPPAQQAPSSSPKWPPGAP